MAVMFEISFVDIQFVATWIGSDTEGKAANKCPAYMKTPSKLFKESKLCGNIYRVDCLYFPPLLLQVKRTLLGTLFL